MGTIKSEKLKEDAYRLMLENGIKTIMASQAQIAETLKKLVSQLEKEKPNVTKKPVRK